MAGGPTVASRPVSKVAVVTGASGWLGQNLVRRLAVSHERVRGLVPVADDGPLLEVIGPNVETVVGDVRDPSAMDRLFDGVVYATVFHTAGVIHPQGQVREVFDVNVGGTQHVLDRARRAGAARFVHVSSNSPFGANARPTDRFDEDSPFHPYMGYGRSKAEAEQIVQRSNDRGDVETVIVRAPWFYGPYQPVRQTQFFSAIRRGRFPLVGDGTQQRSMAYTGNLVDGLLLAESVAAAAGRAYWIADAEPYELRAVLDGVRAALEAEGFSVSPRRPRVPVLAASFAAFVDGVLQDRGRYLQPAHVLGELRDTIACDITRAREELGYEPAVGLVEGMRASIRWCVERGVRL